MNLINFVKYGLNCHHVHPSRISMPEKSNLIPGQACSIRELFIRQQQGLPLPPMSNGFVFNGLGIDELPTSSGRYSDRSSHISELAQLQQSLKEKGLKYNIQNQ